MIQRSFVLADGWDSTCAAHFGFCTCLLNRAGALLEVLGIVPTLTVRDLADLTDWSQ